MVSQPSREAKREGRPGPRARAEKVREEPGGRHARHRRRGTTPRARDAADRGAKRLGVKIPPRRLGREKLARASNDRVRGARGERAAGPREAHLAPRWRRCFAPWLRMRAAARPASGAELAEGSLGRTQTVNYGVARRCFDLRKGNTQNQITLKTIRMSILGRLNRRFLGLDSRESSRDAVRVTLVRKDAVFGARKRCLT